LAFVGDINTLCFSNGILGSGINYTTVSTSAEIITLSIVPGFHWRNDVENLPAFLILLAVNAGEGFVAVGDTDAAEGQAVATIFEKPAIYSSNAQLYQTHSYELRVKGVGFTRILGKPELKFNPPLVEGVDYTIRIIDRTELAVTLLDGRAWRSDAGPLTIAAVNTKGTEDGWVVVGGNDGIHVAEVVEDMTSESTGGIEVFPGSTKVYQSTLYKDIIIAGTGFTEGISFIFEPEIKDVDYILEVNSKSQITLQLRTGRKWRQDAGPIIAKMVKVGGKDYSLAGGCGIRVGVVLVDPILQPGTARYHESRSKVVSIGGTGFTNAADTKVVLRFIPPSFYQVVTVLDDIIQIQLNTYQFPKARWLPPFLTLTGVDSDKQIPLQIVGLDTGGGMINYETPETAGFIISD
jgi:hypothetical protein